jgi:hypothetical protein
MSIDALIQAAQYLEENGEEQNQRNRSRTHRCRNKKPTSYSRTTHNLLEKNRRAQLRDCLEVLRQHVPLPDKLTTLALLQSAKKYIEGLQQKEKDDIDAKMKLQHEQSVLLSRLAELGASHVKCLLSVKTHNPPPQSSPSPSPCSPSYSNPESFDSTSSFGHETKMKVQRSTSLSDDLDSRDDEESMVIDVMTHDSDDETSSTTSGSDGGCTATTHKIQIAV